MMPAQRSMRAPTASGLSRTLHIKCATWAQVDDFTQNKLRRGNLLTARLPFGPDAQTSMPVALNLPNQVIFTFDAIVRTVARIEGTDRWWVELELIGYHSEIQQRLRSLVQKEGRTRPARISRAESIVEEQDVELPADERALFAQLTNDLRRMRTQPAHALLGIDATASVELARRAWLAMLPRYHPDVFAQYRSPAISHLAEELTILLHRAVARMQHGQKAQGWMISFDELGNGEIAAPSLRRRASTAPVSTTTEAVEARARALLAEGNIEAAQEHLAGALLAFPRSRPLRVLYYVCGALRAFANGEKEFARSQLEAALSHDRENPIVVSLMERVRAGTFDGKGLRKIFE